MTQAHATPSLQMLLASALGLSRRDADRLVYGALLDDLDHYEHFTVPKRNGGVRQISAPKPQLRQAQQWVLRHILDPIPVHAAAMAFRPGRSVVHNARLHAGRGLVIRLDLENFFPSITFPRVQDLFAGMDAWRHASQELACLTTAGPGRSWTWSLPQGACTSPALSNLACREMDAALTTGAADQGFLYTRYADDLVFSHADAAASVGHLLTLARAVIADQRFTVNDEKTRVMRHSRRQIVTGVVVNADPRISRTDARRFRAFLHQCDTRGFDVMSHELGKDALSYARGYLAYVQMVNPGQAARFEVDHPWLGGRADRRGSGSNLRDTSGESDLSSKQDADLIGPVASFVTLAATCEGDSGVNSS